MFNKKLKEIVFQLADNLDEVIRQFDRVSGRYYNTRKDVELLQEGELKDLNIMSRFKYKIEELKNNTENNRQNLNLLFDYLKVCLELDKGQKVIKKYK
jgi:uncharacterized protein YgfB (UPF0149 family)